MRLFGKVPVLFVASLFLSLLFTPPIALAGTGGNVTCGTSQNPVTIDGKWTTQGEWTDAVDFSLLFVQGSGEVYFKAKHDDHYLYALIDFVSDAQIQAQDNGDVIFDTKNDGGSATQTDDFLVMGRWNSPSQFVSVKTSGTGSGWGSFQGLTTGFKVASSNDATNDPYSSSSHVIYEFQIPMSALNPSGVGIYVAAFDRAVNIAAWPLGPAEVPSDYGYMEFTNQVVPEFPMGTAVILLLLLGAAGVILRFPRKPYPFKQRS
jgi:hypothetical protein